MESSTGAFISFQASKQNTTTSLCHNLVIQDAFLFNPFEYILELQPTSKPPDANGRISPFPSIQPKLPFSSSVVDEYLNWLKNVLEYPFFSKFSPENDYLESLQRFLDGMMARVCVHRGDVCIVVSTEEAPIISKLFGPSSANAKYNTSMLQNMTPNERSCSAFSKLFRSSSPTKTRFFAHDLTFQHELVYSTLFECYTTKAFYVGMLAQLQHHLPSIEVGSSMHQSVWNHYRILSDEWKDEESTLPPLAGFVAVDLTTADLWILERLYLAFVLANRLLPKLSSHLDQIFSFSDLKLPADTDDSSAARSSLPSVSTLNGSPTSGKIHVEPTPYNITKIHVEQFKAIYTYIRLQKAKILTKRVVDHFRQHGIPSCHSHANISYFRSLILLKYLRSVSLRLRNMGLEEKIIVIRCLAGMHFLPALDPKTASGPTRYYEHRFNLTTRAFREAEITPKVLELASSFMHAIRYLCRFGLLESMKSLRLEEYEDSDWRFSSIWNLGSSLVMKPYHVPARPVPNGSWIQGLRDLFTDEDTDMIVSHSKLLGEAGGERNRQTPNGKNAQRQSISKPNSKETTSDNTERNSHVLKNTLSNLSQELGHEWIAGEGQSTLTHQTAWDGNASAATASHALPQTNSKTSKVDYRAAFEEYVPSHLLQQSSVQDQKSPTCAANATSNGGLTNPNPYQEVFEKIQQLFDCIKTEPFLQMPNFVARQFSSRVPKAVLQNIVDKFPQYQLQSSCDRKISNLLPQLGPPEANLTEIQEEQRRYLISVIETLVIYYRMAYTPSRLTLSKIVDIDESLTTIERSPKSMETQFASEQPSSSTVSSEGNDVGSETFMQSSPSEDVYSTYFSKFTLDKMRCDDDKEYSSVPFNGSPDPKLDPIVPMPPPRRDHTHCVGSSQHRSLTIPTANVIPPRKGGSFIITPGGSSTHKATANMCFPPLSATSSQTSATLSHFQDQEIDPSGIEKAGSNGKELRAGGSPKQPLAPIGQEVKEYLKTIEQREYKLFDDSLDTLEVASPFLTPVAPFAEPPSILSFMKPTIYESHGGELDIVLNATDEVRITEPAQLESNESNKDSLPVMHAPKSPVSEEATPDESPIPQSKQLTPLSDSAATSPSPSVGHIPLQTDPRQNIVPSRRTSSTPLQHQQPKQHQQPQHIQLQHSYLPVSALNPVQSPQSVPPTQTHASQLAGFGSRPQIQPHPPGMAQMGALPAHAPPPGIVPQQVASAPMPGLQQRWIPPQSHLSPYPMFMPAWAPMNRHYYAEPQHSALKQQSVAAPSASSSSSSSNTPIATLQSVGITDQQIHLSPTPISPSNEYDYFLVVDRARTFTNGKLAVDTLYFGLRSMPTIPLSNPFHLLHPLNVWITLPEGTNVSPRDPNHPQTDLPWGGRAIQVAVMSHSEAIQHFNNHLNALSSVTFQQKKPRQRR